MSLWMAIALAQATFLPGYLLTRALRLDEDGALGTALRAFAFTPIVNHFLALALVLAGAHARPAWLAILAVELGLGAWLLRRPHRPGLRASARVVAYVEAGPRHRPALLALALGCMVFLASSVPDAFASVFREWDAVISWNRWAMDWAEGLWPVWVAWYPQLLPLNGSVVYVLQGEALPFLHHGILALFEVATALVLFDLALTTRRDGPMLAIPFLTLLVATGFGPWRGAGYADLPLAFYGLMALAPLLAGPLDPGPGPDRARLAACVLGAVGAALAKQPGVYVAVLLPAFVALRLEGCPLRERLATAAAVGVATGAAIAPWYGWAALQVERGLEPETWARLDEVIPVDGVVARARAAFALWEARLPAPLLLPVLALAVGGLARPGFVRWVTLLVSLPFPLLWSQVASYDLRNCSLALPFVALSAAHGAAGLASAVARRTPEAWHGRLAPGAVGVALAATFLVLVDGDRLRARRDAQAAEVGWRPLNERILEFEARTGFTGRILTNYWIARDLPPLRGRLFVDREAGPALHWPLRSVAAFERALADPANDVRFILVRRPLRHPEVLQRLVAGIRSGRFRVEFDAPAGYLLRVARPPGGAPRAPGPKAPGPRTGSP